MGKKKDKASKSKKQKSDRKQAHASRTGVVEPTESEAGETGSAAVTAAISPYAELVSTEDVMELVTSMDQNLDQLDKSTQSLQQQIAHNQQSLQRQLMTFKIIAVVLVIAIFSVGYSGARSSAQTTSNVDAVTADTASMKEQIDQINISIGTMSANMAKFDKKLNVVSANVAGVNKTVNQVATDVGKINTNNNAAQPYDPWRTGHYWR